MNKKILELFAGSRCIGRAAEEMNMEVFSVDWEPFPNIDLVADVGGLSINDIPFVPDAVWASPDCTTYSIAAISHHRNGTEPKSEYAIKCDAVNQHFIGLINEWLEINPNMVFFIENPRGMLRKMPFMQQFKRHTVWYCFTGETEVITKEGYKQFKDIVNTNQLLLMKDGSWKEAPIKHFGQQEIYKLTLSRAGRKKVIRTTKNHKWFIRLLNHRVVIVNTIDLKKSDVIPSVYPKQEESTFSNWSVVSVEPENVIEDVYCAEVEGYESFVLADNILTHNCQYGDERAKPTDIWTNSTTWVPRPMCHNGNKNCHHAPAPRGSKTGTQGRKGSFERSMIPKELCVEILKSI